MYLFNICLLKLLELEMNPAQWFCYYLTGLLLSNLSFFAAGDDGMWT